ncbi:hypothetical protein HK096_001990, partial [Nowakowskiella sp. JEL0078]
LSVQGDKSDVLNTAITGLVDMGIHVVSASGNNASNACAGSPSSAALNSSIISVGATDNTDEVPTFSNFGQCVTILAPGKDILSVNYQGGFKILSGTSMASPHVAGAIAVIVSRNISTIQSPIQVKNYVVNSSTQGILTIQGNGINYAGMLN